VILAKMLTNKNLFRQDKIFARLKSAKKMGLDLEGREIER
jgi:hypothetical protein